MQEHAVGRPVLATHLGHCHHYVTRMHLLSVCFNTQEGEPLGRHVVIVDDLVQSGGTLIECHALLSSLGATHGECVWVGGSGGEGFLVGMWLGVVGVGGVWVWVWVQLSLWPHSQVHDNLCLSLADTLFLFLAVASACVCEQ